MSENKKHKRSFDYANDINHTSSRPKRKRIESLLMDSLDKKEIKLNNLGSNCLQHILSFVTFEKVSQMRQVCKAFNETGKKLLAKGHRELERRLKGEIERAEKMVISPTNVQSSYDMICFLKSLDEAIYDCTISYKYHIDYFVAGKLLDGVNSLLEDFNSWTMLPYFSEHACDQKPHPLLGLFIAQASRAWRHFRNKILRKSIYYDSEAALDGAEQNYLELRILQEQNEVGIIKTNLLKNLRQRINCGNEMNGELLKLMVKLNESVLALIQRVKELDEEVKGVIIKGKHMLNNEGLSNCLLQLSSPSSWQLEKTQMVGIRVGSKRLNLATLPSSCIQNILSYFNCDKMARLRTTCKSFNDASKKEINREFENVKQKLEFQIKINEKRDMRSALRLYALETNVMKDLCGFLQLCKDYNEQHLAAGYYFAAGRVVDEAKHVIYTNRGQLGYHIFHEVDSSYEFQPHYLLFHIIDVVYKAIAHFKFKIVPKYLPLTKNQTYIPDFIISGVEMNLEKESQANVGLKEIEKLIEKIDGEIKEQNDRNGKLLQIISGLKKKVFILNKEINEKNECIKRA